MKKTLIALLLLIAMMMNVLILSGCDLLLGDKTNDGDEWNNEEVEGKINITFYHTMGANLRTVLNEYLAKFEAQYPNIHVIHEQVGSYDDVRTQIATELTQGGGPNLAYCYPDHVALYNVAKAVKVLDDLIDGGASTTKAGIMADGTVANLGLTAEEKADFIEGYYNEGKQFGDNKMYTMPFSKSTEVLYYNQTKFEEWAAKYAETGDEKYNIKVPTTWDEMEEVCEKILAIDPECTPLGYDSESNWFITMCEQLNIPYTSAENGGEFLFNNPEAKAFVKRFREWYQKGYVTTQELNGGYTSGLFVAPTTGPHSYMSIGSSAGATHQRPSKDSTGNYPFVVGIAPIPQANPEAPKVISQGPSICILDDTDEKVEASWLLVKYLTTNAAFQADFSIASGYVPVIKSVENDDVYIDEAAKANGGDGIAALSTKVCLEQANAYYTSPAFNGSSAARDQVGALMQACFKIPDGADIDAEMDKLFAAAISECNRLAGK